MNLPPDDHAGPQVPARGAGNPGTKARRHEGTKGRTESQVPARRTGLLAFSLLTATWLAALLFALPLLWIAISSTRSADQALEAGLSVLPAALAVSGMVISSAVIAYGFSRVQWRGRDAVFAIVLGTMMIPFPALMAPQYLLFKKLGWIGTFLPLWLPAWFGGAFSIFLLRQFFRTLPRELDEAARLDGCSHVGIFLRIILPLSRPVLATVALLHFVYTWNDYLGPLVFLNHQRQYTLALGLQMYQSQHGGTPWNLVMAATVLTIAPVAAMFLAAQKAFVEGVATQGVKE
ncbi:MAG: carbohydrate ABC transporter permease [Planctomycetes bacterium]|nr:carbohydrate ABC transporter permease [Planctomycetota bacterium]